MVALTRLWSPPAPVIHPTHPQSQLVILQELEKAIRKTSSIQVASRISYEMLTTYITTISIQDTWCDCIVPHEKYNSINISN